MPRKVREPLFPQLLLDVHDELIVNLFADGRALTKTEQVRMVGNSVCPPMAAALVSANVPELIARDEVAVA